MTEQLGRQSTSTSTDPRSDDHTFREPRPSQRFRGRAAPHCRPAGDRESGRRSTHGVEVVGSTRIPRPPEGARQFPRRDRHSRRIDGGDHFRRDRKTQRRRTTRSHAGRRTSRLGGTQRTESVAPQTRRCRTDQRQPVCIRWLPADGRRRRDRPLELSAVHTDGVDRLRTGRRQRRSLQTERTLTRRRRRIGPAVEHRRTRTPCPADHYR